MPGPPAHAARALRSGGKRRVGGAPPRAMQGRAGVATLRSARVRRSPSEESERRKDRPGKDRPGGGPDGARKHGPEGSEPQRRNRGTGLARDDLIQATGTVEKILGGGRYQITLESGQTVTAQLSGRMRRFRIRVIPGDRVQVGLSPYDPTHGFITFRLREGQNA